MPIYEYVSTTDNERLELLRPMADADKPVDDPAGKGRKFVRVLSTFAAQGTSQSSSSSSGSSHKHTGSCCPCGKSSSACSRTN